jgi:hypothetical protein
METVGSSILTCYPDLWEGCHPELQGELFVHQKIPYPIGIIPVDKSDIF